MTRVAQLIRNLKDKKLNQCRAKSQYKIINVRKIMRKKSRKNQENLGKAKFIETLLRSL